MHRNVSGSMSNVHVDDDDSSPPDNRESSEFERLMLTTDAFNVVLSFLFFSDYVILRCTCRGIKNAVSRASHLFMEAHHQHQQVVGNNTSSFDTRWTEASLTRLLQHYQDLRVMQLTGLGPIGDKLFSVLNHSSCRTLQSVSLHGANLSYWMSDSLRLHHLKHLQISGGAIRASLKSLFRSCQQLDSLAITQCSTLRDANVADLVPLLEKSLSSLSLHQCLRLKKPAVLHFPHLERLSLMGCFNLTRLSDGLQFPPSSTTSDENEDGSSDDDAVRKVTALRLCSLDLSFCFRLNTAELERLLLIMPYLEELTLIKCMGLTSLKISQHTHLRVLNVSFCQNLHTLEIKETPSLVTLNTMGCSKLETLVVDQKRSFAHEKDDLSYNNKLTSLNLSSLPSLARLEIYALHLKCLDLAQCRRLDRVSVHCPALEQVNLWGCRTVALRFCKSVRRVILHDWMERRSRTFGNSSARHNINSVVHVRSADMVQ